MGERVTLSRAITLLGIERRALQILIRQGELETFEGKVDLDDVTRYFPHLAISNEAPINERLELIKRSAFSRRVSSHVAPDQDAIEIQLKRRTTEAGVQKARAQKYQEIVDALMKELGRLRCDGCAMASSDLIDHLTNWLSSRIRDRES